MTLVDGVFEHTQFSEHGERLRVRFNVIDRDPDNPTKFIVQASEICLWNAEGELVQRWPEELEEVCGGESEEVQT